MPHPRPFRFGVPMAVGPCGGAGTVVVENDPMEAMAPVVARLAHA